MHHKEGPLGVNLFNSLMQGRLGEIDHIERDREGEKKLLWPLVCLITRDREGAGLS